MHDPLSLGAPRGAPLIEDERLLDADLLPAAPGGQDRFVRAGGLPVPPARRRPVRPVARRVLAGPLGEEVPPAPLPEVPELICDIKSCFSLHSKSINPTLLMV